MQKRKVRYLFEEKVYVFPNSREVERIRTGKPPDKGKKREKKKKATPEQIKRQNEYNRQKKSRRTIKANFKENDLWETLTYKRGHVVTIEQAKADKEKFLRYVRKEYAKRGEVLKWVGCYERGRRGAIHFHFIINRIPDADLIIKEAWKRVKGSGRIDSQLLYEDGDFKNLASYIVKAEAYDDDGNLIKASCFSHSRNLVIPEPEVRRTTRKKILEEPVPTPGYYIDKDSICQGINPITGREYLHYIEIRIRGGGG